MAGTHLAAMMLALRLWAGAWAGGEWAVDADGAVRRRCKRPYDKDGVARLQK